MNNKQKNMPILAITMGDPAGIGPEIAAKAFSNIEVYNNCYPVLIGNVFIMQSIINSYNLNLKINRISEISYAKFKPGTIDIFEINSNNTGEIRFGEVSASAGDLAFKSIKIAIDLALQGKVDGNVTGPIHKESINRAGYNFSGHTEIYAHYTNTRNYAMLLADDDIRIVHVTTHVPLRKACDLIKKERILEVIDLLNNGLKRLGISLPKIGVAGLNPHSSDGGLFGSEEIEEIIPAIEKAKKSGILVEGPVPPDVLFVLAKGGKYDGCVAMYHDQGHIPFKLLGFKWDKKKKLMNSIRGVNITLGLPFIRTSVDHGTAFEIAGKGVASPEAMIQAIEYATRLIN